LGPLLSLPSFQLFREPRNLLPVCCGPSFTIACLWWWKNLLCVCGGRSSCLTLLFACGCCHLTVACLWWWKNPLSAGGGRHLTITCLWWLALLFVCGGGSLATIYL
jgi:hypothetical protein